MKFISFLKFACCLLFIYVFLNTNVFAQKTDWQRDELKGKVKSVKFYSDSKLRKIRTYNSNGFEVSLKNFCLGKVCGQDTTIYDTQGNKSLYIDDSYIIDSKFDTSNNPLETISRNKWNKKITSKELFWYVNSKVIKTEQTNYQYASNEPQLKIVIDYTYDSIGNLITEINSIIEHEKNVSTKTSNRYDKWNNLVETIITNSEGLELHKYSYTINEKNKVISYHSRSHGSSSYTNYNEFYTYDEMGNKIEESHYTLDSNLLYKDVYVYDYRGNQIKRSHYYGAKLTGEQVMTYSDSNLVLEELNANDGIIVLRKTFTYDTKGNLVKCIDYDSAGLKLSEFKYVIEYY